MPIAWTAEMDRKLLLAIIKVHDFPIDKDKIAAELSTGDQLCTSMAIKKRFQAIKAMIKNGGGVESTPKVKATPRKRRATITNADDESPTKKGKTGKGNGGKAKAAEDDEEIGEGAAVKDEGAEEDEF